MLKCCFSLSLSLLCFVLFLIHSLSGAVVWIEDPSRAVGRVSSHHLLTPLAAAGLLQAAACGLNGQHAGGKRCRQATAAVHRQGEIHR